MSNPKKYLEYVRLICVLKKIKNKEFPVYTLVISTKEINESFILSNEDYYDLRASFFGKTPDLGFEIFTIDLD